MTIPQITAIIKTFLSNMNSLDTNKTTRKIYTNFVGIETGTCKKQQVRLINGIPNPFV